MKPAFWEHPDWSGGDNMRSGATPFWMLEPKAPDRAGSWGFEHHERSIVRLSQQEVELAADMGISPVEFARAKIFTGQLNPCTKGIDAMSRVHHKGRDRRRIGCCCGGHNG